MGIFLFECCFQYLRSLETLLLWSPLYFYFSFDVISIYFAGIAFAVVTAAENDGCSSYCCTFALPCFLELNEEFFGYFGDTFATTFHFNRARVRSVMLSCNDLFSVSFSSISRPPQGKYAAFSLHE